MPDGGCRCGSHRAGRDTSGDVTSAQDPGADSAGEDAVTDQDHRADPWGWALVEGLGRRDHHGGRDGRDDDLRGQDPILLYYVNDARALKAAQVGVALRSGSAVTRDVADIVLLDDSFGALLPPQREAVASST